VEAFQSEPDREQQNHKVAFLLVVQALKPIEADCELCHPEKATKHLVQKQPIAN
jgi:hypothetical protein